MNGQVLNADRVGAGFYVVEHECIACGAPEMEAPELMTHCRNGECRFVRQPVTSEQIDSAIRALRASCCGAVRYGGQDKDILLRLAELGLREQCDSKTPDVSLIQRVDAIFMLDFPGTKPQEACEAVLDALMRSMWDGKAPA